jgi:HK97 family phage portal protein
LTDTAWLCLDLNASVLASMPPYLLGNPDSLDVGWLRNPDPDLYGDWTEFGKQLAWDYMLGEVFVLCTARYSTGYPARFHVVAPWLVEVEMDNGFRRYSIGQRDYTSEILHIRYKSSTDDAHGHGPLEVGAARMVADRVLARYAQEFAAQGGIPASILTHPEELSKQQAADLQAQWVEARTTRVGMPAVLSGGVSYEAVQMSPKDMALIELQQLTQSRVAVLLGVPPFLVGLPGGGDPMTYSNVSSMFDYHWRAGLRPKAQAMMGALTQWALPRGTSVEVNRDAYVQPEPEARARTAAILNGIRDPQGNPALTVDEIREVERLRVAGAAGVTPPPYSPEPAIPPAPQEVVPNE